MAFDFLINDNKQSRDLILSRDINARFVKVSFPYIHYPLHLPLTFIPLHYNISKGSAIPLEAYQHTSVSEDDVLSPPQHPAAVWLPNSCVCITWDPPDLEDGKNAGITVAGYKVRIWA